METHLLAEKMDRKRSHMILLSLVGFTLGYGIHIIRTHFLPDPVYTFLTPIALLGGLLFIISSFQQWRFMGQLRKNVQMQRILNDEWTASVRSKAWTVGFVTVVLVQVAIVITAMFYPFSARAAAELSIFAAVVSCQIAFLVYHR